MKNIKRKILAATISASLVLGSVAVLAPTTAMAAQTAVVESGVNFRTAPSTSSSKIRLLKTGEKLTVLSKYNRAWYKVKDSKGKTGYVSSLSKYITVKGSASSGSSNTSSGSGSGTTAPASGSVEKVIAAGMKYIGTPYEYGSSRSTTKTFDCSDFVRQAFIDGVGIKLSADSRGQGKYVKDKGNAVSNWKQLKRGDLMFFMSYKGTSASAYSGVNKSTARITHDGIYLGDGKILHTYSKESGGVTISKIAGTHWEKRFLFGGSAL
ncbi:MAG: C40 family peptidase [Candidatus Pristimantibacillus sp.]